MALPVTISGASFPAQNYHCGPFKAPNGSIYVVLLNAGGTPEVYKGTDPTTSFAAQDAGNNPAATPLSMSATIHGADIHIATAKNSATHIQYHLFSTATDTWTTTDETIEDLSADPPVADASYSVAIAVRSDGDIIVLYNGLTEKVKGADTDRVVYAREEGAGWTVGVAVGATGGAEHQHGSVSVRGEQDKVHFFWGDDDGNFRHRSLSSANSLGTAHVVDSGAGATIDHKGVYAAYYQSGGFAERITVLYGKGSNTLASSFVQDDGTPDTPENITTDCKVANSTPVASGGKDVQTILAAYAQDSDDDLFSSENTDDGGWSAPSEDVDAVTINRISARAFARNGGLKLAYVYDNGGTVQYNERSRTAPTAPSFANSQFPQNDSHVGPFRADV